MSQIRAATIRERFPDGRGYDFSHIIFNINLMNLSYMRQLTVCVCLLLVSTLLLTGCGKKRPDGLGKTYPCTIEVTNGGEPLDDARIVLLSKTGIGFSMAGKTDSKGVAKIITEFDFPGVPEGTYSVSIVKPPKSSFQEKSRAEISKMSMEEGRAYHAARDKAKEGLARIVPEYLEVPSASPISIEVTASGENKFKFELNDYSTPPPGWKPPNTNYDSSRR